MTGYALLGLAAFFLVMVVFIHRYFGRSITRPAARELSAVANVSPFTGEIGFRDEVDDTPRDCGGGTG
jgi:hypothetical protein